MGIKKFILCHILGMHDWTSKAEQGIPPTIPVTITDANSKTSGGLTELDFWEYAKMYCKCCGKVSPLSQKEIDRVKNELAQKEKEQFIKNLLKG